jgi:hypothetical protein
MTTPEPNWRRKLETDAAEGRRAQAELQALRDREASLSRELLFRRAGVDPDTAGGRLLWRAYDGPLETEAIRAEAAAVGALSDPYAGDRAAMQRMAAAQAGGAPSGGYVPDFQAQLDAIPMVVNGQYNPNYISDVMAKTAEQAAREGREFEISGGQITFQPGSAGPNPATNPL